MNLLEIKNLQFTHAGTNSTNFKFDLALKPGQILAVTGKSGSGKSTLLDLIAGFLQPSGGRIVVDDHDITDLPPSQRQISILFQKNNLFEHLSVLENVCLGLNPKSRPSSNQRIQASEMLTQMGLAGFEQRSAGSLSGGQMQRTALARELLRQSKLILLDEPFNGLDDEAKDQMLPLLRDAVADGERSIILVTHDPAGVRDICDQISMVENGEIRLISTEHRKTS